MSTSFPQIDDWSRRLNALGREAAPCFFLLDFEQQRPRVWDLRSPAPDLPRFDFPGRPDPETAPQGLLPVRLVADHIPAETFRRAFEIVRTGLQRGDSFLTNLTFPTPVYLSGELEDIYWQAEAKYRIFLADEFVCFSPETFVTVDESGYIESRPMKGTAVDNPAAREDLLKSTKEIAEHATIVDLIRNDLSQIAKRVRVTDYRYFHKIATSSRGLVQTSSKVGGQLPGNWKDKLGTMLVRLLPAGSVSGAPKPATLDLIRSAEPGPRGYYCGIAGYFDGQTLDTCVLIRFVQKQKSGGFVFRSGGGITARSIWTEEYEELMAKIRIPGQVGHFSLH